MKKIATFCGDEGCEWCPEVFVDESGDSSQEIKITDDFGNTVKMSKGQFSQLVIAVKNGKFQ